MCVTHNIAWALHACISMCGQTSWFSGALQICLAWCFFFFFRSLPSLPYIQHQYSVRMEELFLFLLFYLTKSRHPCAPFFTTAYTPHSIYLGLNVYKSIAYSIDLPIFFRPIDISACTPRYIFEYIAIVCNDKKKTLC